MNFLYIKLLNIFCGWLISKTLVFILNVESFFTEYKKLDFQKQKQIIWSK